MPYALLTFPSPFSQQNLYAAILSDYYGVKVDRMVLLQLHPGQQTYVEHEVPDMKEEIGIVFAQRREEVAASQGGLKRKNIA